MNVADQQQMFAALAAAQLQGQPDPAVRRRIVQAAGEMLGIPPEVIRQVAEQLAPATPDVLPDEPPAAETAQDAPQLLADFGQELHAGAQAVAEFHLLAPAAWGLPRVRGLLSPALDQQTWNATPVAEPAGDGRWVFRQEFSLTSRGAPCRPGHFGLRLEVAFPAAPAGATTRFRAHVRLQVLSPALGTGRTLEVVGDGHALINLHGRNLQSYARVVLRGSDHGAINVQEALPAAGEEPVSSPPHDAPPGLLRLLLRPETAGEALVRQTTGGWTRGGVQQTAGLVLPDGRSILIQSRRTVQLGRDRKCHIVLRLLPRNAERDALSEQVARTHFSLAGSDRGLELRKVAYYSSLRVDQKELQDHRKSLLDDSPGRQKTMEDLAQEFQDRYKLLLDGSPDWRQLELGGVLHLQLKTFRRAEDWDIAEELQTMGSGEWDDWRVECALDAALLTRLNNADELNGQEEYVLLLRQALLGSGPRCAVRLPQECRPVHGRLINLGATFWVENLTRKSHEVQIDGFSLPPGEWAPLSPGQELQMGSVRMAFSQWQQKHVTHPLEKGR